MLISISCLFLAGDGVGAHEAKTGWRYPYACCSNKDCREVPARMVNESAEGYVIRTTGEIISYDDKRIRHSPDGVFHWCSISGKADTKTICLFVPPKAF
ncbi:hypothetical protein [Nitratireductor basaltis]|uniref:hypothetical protein n=1 Tax=Nitratireductor basaltis TaxID=472175 RepID=UPI00068CFB76|nr:hypothetical protein [Nitratireductor basaltis]